MIFTVILVFIWWMSDNRGFGLQLSNQCDNLHRFSGYIVLMVFITIIHSGNYGNYGKSHR